MTFAVILFAHGSKDPLWSRPIEAVTARVAALAPDLPVRCAYLENTAPDLATVVQELSGAGLRRIRILPLFLGVGRHARQDLPEMVRSQAALHPELQLELQPSVGEHPMLVDLLARIALSEGEAAPSIDRNS